MLYGRWGWLNQFWGVILVPNVDWDVASKILTILVPAATGLAGLRKSDSRLRATILEEVEILEKLPEGAKAREVLMGVLEADIERLADRRDWRRDWPMVVFAVVFATLFGYLAIWLIQQKVWWGWVGAVPTAVVTTFFLYGLFESAQLAPRGEKGKRKR